jgi:hypothetical protein
MHFIFLGSFRSQIRKKIQIQNLFEKLNRKTIGLSIKCRLEKDQRLTVNGQFMEKEWEQRKMLSLMRQFFVV